MDEFKGLFIKIGQLEHLQSLQLEGLIYCQTLQYFANLRDELGKGDYLENVVYMKYYEDAKMYLIPYDDYISKIIPVDISGSHRYKRIISHCGNLFCLYTLNFKDLPFNQLKSLKLTTNLGHMS